MYTGKTLFSQLMGFLPWTTFTRIVARHGGDERFERNGYAVGSAFRLKLMEGEICLNHSILV